QTAIEPERLTIDIDPIVLELMAPWHVARREDLCDASQSRAHAVPFSVAWNVFHGDVGAMSARLDFAWPERPGANKAHVPNEDVPQLWELVHCGRPHQPSDSGHSRITRGRLQGADAGLRVGNHRAELQRTENAPALSHAFLTEEHGTAVFHLD